MAVLDKAKMDESDSWGITLSKMIEFESKSRRESGSSDACSKSGGLSCSLSRDIAGELGRHATALLDGGGAVSMMLLSIERMRTALWLPEHSLKGESGMTGDRLAKEAQ